MKKIWLIVLLLAGWGSGIAYTQTTLQVVSKNIEKAVSWKPGMELIVNGEKADVVVMPTDSAHISVSAELSAKHPSLDTAQSDVGAWQFLVSIVGKKIYIRSYVGVVAGKRPPVSNMKARILIAAPRICPVNLSNKFGKAQLERLDGPVVLSGSFCRFELLALTGELHIDSQFGAIEGRDLKGKIGIKGKRADVSLQKTTGDCVIEAEYGTVRFASDQETGNVRIAAQMADVTVNTSDATTHNFRLKAKYGQVQAPEQFDKSGSTDKETNATFSTKTKRPTIDVETSFGKIKVEP